MRVRSKQIDIFAAIDQALGEDDGESRTSENRFTRVGAEHATGSVLEVAAPMPESQRSAMPAGHAKWSREVGKYPAIAAEAGDHPYNDEARAIYHACLSHHIPPPDGDTSAMSAGALHNWCRAASVRCQMVLRATTDPALHAVCLAARDFYVRCAILLQLSLERTYAHLFLLPWQEMVAQLDVETARAIEFVQAAIAYDNAFTENDRLRAGAMLRPAHGRLSRLGLIPEDAPLVAAAPGQ